MPIIKHNPEGVFPPYRNYSHAVEIKGDSRLLIISGLNGYLHDGKSMPESFEEQGELIWQHIGTILKAAEMDYQNIISVRTYLADPSYDEANIQLRVKYLGANRPALTVVACQLLEKKWKLEVEVMAAK
ncbi:MAG: RidA family protein [Bacteroidetes bacterium]|nr:RidA family protein [Bacteroidota bacterium]